MAESKGELVVLHDRRDRLEANRVVRKLESAGYRVALKDSPLGQRRAKTEAPTVVLWSRHAGARNIGAVLNSETAVIAKIDGRAAPAGATVTDLRGWRGQDAHQGWKVLLEAVGPAMPASATATTKASTTAAAKPASKTAAAPAAKPVKAAAIEAAPEKKGGAGGVIALVIALAVAAGAAGWAYTQHLINF